MAVDRKRTQQEERLARLLDRAGERTTGRQSRPGGLRAGVVGILEAGHQDPDGWGDDSLLMLDRVRAALQMARTLPDIGAVREVAERARRYASAAKLGREAENHAARLRIEAERRAGEILADAPKNAGGRPEETGRMIRPVSERPPKLSELGISKQQASDWQRIAKLPEDVFERHVEQVASAGKPLTTEGVVQLARQLERQVRASAPGPTPMPHLIPAGARIEVADARALPIDDETVHLTVTSPPYAIDKQGYLGGGDVPADEWPAFLEDVLREVLRVTVPSGRLALNVPLDTTSGGCRPAYAQAVQAALSVGWTYRSTIVWLDDHLGRSVARGSNSAAAPHVIAPAECIALFSKGDWKRERPGPSDLTREEWLTWTNGVWRIQGETRAWEGHPSPFPSSIPHRLIKLLSFPGDLVLDPFVGSGTTAVEAVLLGRRAIGTDRAAAYVTSTLRRLATLGGD